MSKAFKIKALGDADYIVVNDLAGTDVKLVMIDLAATGGGDRRRCGRRRHRNGSNGNNVISVCLLGGAVSVAGLAALVTIKRGESRRQRHVNGLGGDDMINASKLLVGAI